MSRKIKVFSFFYIQTQIVAFSYMEDKQLYSKPQHTTQEKNKQTKKTSR